MNQEQISLTKLLELPWQSKVTLIGCGGKTSLMELLARENKDNKVLMTTTTKIRVPYRNIDYLCLSLSECRVHQPQKGIQCMGIKMSKGEKLHGLPGDELNKIVAGYDLTLIEGDGSKMLPLKGWAEFEPVVPAFTTHTIGVVTLNGLGRVADEQFIHRLPLFLDLVGKPAGTVIELFDIAKMVFDEAGMFREGQGKNILIINQVEDEATFQQALCLSQHIRRERPDLLTSCIVGSCQQELWQRFW